MPEQHIPGPDAIVDSMRVMLQLEYRMPKPGAMALAEKVSEVIQARNEQQFLSVAVNETVAETVEGNVFLVVKRAYVPRSIEEDVRTFVKGALKGGHVVQYLHPYDVERFMRCAQHFSNEHEGVELIMNVGREMNPDKMPFVTCNEVALLEDRDRARYMAWDTEYNFTGRRP